MSSTISTNSSSSSVFPYPLGTRVDYNSLISSMDEEDKDNWTTATVTGYSNQQNLITGKFSEKVNGPEIYEFSVSLDLLSRYIAPLYKYTENKYKPNRQGDLFDYLPYYKTFTYNHSSDKDSWVLAVTTNIYEDGSIRGYYIQRNNSSNLDNSTMIPFYLSSKHKKSQITEAYVYSDPDSLVKNAPCFDETFIEIYVDELKKWCPGEIRCTDVADKNLIIKYVDMLSDSNQEEEEIKYLTLSVREFYKKIVPSNTYLNYYDNQQHYKNNWRKYKIGESIYILDTDDDIPVGIILGYTIFGDVEIRSKINNNNNLYKTIYIERSLIDTNTSIVL